MLGVVALGALQGIGIAVALAMLVLLYLSSRPAEAILGRVEGGTIVQDGDFFNPLQS